MTLTRPNDLRTPDEWLALKHPGIRVHDPDGWRGANGRPWTDPISEAEFDKRLPWCTISGSGMVVADASTGNQEAAS